MSDGHCNECGTRESMYETKVGYVHVCPKCQAKRIAELTESLRVQDAANIMLEGKLIDEQLRAEAAEKVVARIIEEKRLYDEALDADESQKTMDSSIVLGDRIRFLHEAIRAAAKGDTA